MKYRYSHHHHDEHGNLYVYLNKKLTLIIKNFEKMSIIQIDVEDNAPDLATAVANFQTAYDALQASTLANLTTALADLQTANAALAAFQISFTASVVPPTA